MKRLIQKFKFSAPLIFLVFIFCITLLSGTYAQAAQGTESGYQLLAPIPTIDKTSGITLVDYMKGLFVATIGLAIIMAVVQIVIGGIGYVAAAVPSAKEEGKRKISGAVGGLLLIFMAYVILQALNPKLLTVGLNLENISIMAQINGGDGSSPTSTGVGDTPNSASCADADTLKTSLANNGTVCGGGGSCHSLCDTSPWNTQIHNASVSYNVPENMIRAIIRHESSCNPNSGSVDGKSCGLMQVTTGCSTDPTANINAGTKKLAVAITNANSVKGQYGNTVSFEELVYNAYNGGGKDNRPSVSCSTGSGWAVIPKWGCPINPGNQQYNACFERSVACGFDKCFNGL